MLEEDRRVHGRHELEQQQQQARRRLCPSLPDSCTPFSFGSEGKVFWLAWCDDDDDEGGEDRSGCHDFLPFLLVHAVAVAIAAVSSQP